MTDDKKSRQQLACDYIQDHYVAFNRLRFDLIAQKVQMRCADCDSLGDKATGLSGDRAQWRYITNADINTMVCDCCAETGASITSKEVLTVLNAGEQYIPRVHPLREYVLSLQAYTPDQPDWIDWVAQQVKVKDNSGEDNKQLKQHNNNSSVGPTYPTVRGEENNLSLERGRELIAAQVVDVVVNKTNPVVVNINTPVVVSDTASEADLLWRACFKKWFVAMVASWLYDDVVNHQVLVLIGKQGIFKTTWLEHLIPPHLRQYCCKLANATQLSKDDRLRIAEFGLINMDELDAMTPRELNAMKSVITASDVNERAAYGYTKERRVRLASFCASSNKREFLTDITGNRRWLPFEVEAIQNPFYTIQPYDLMYAQARYLLEQEFNYWFDLDEIAQMEEHNESFRAQDSEEQLLPILFDVPAEGKGEFMTTAQISERLVTFGNIKKPMSITRLGMLLGTAGYKSVRPKVAGRLVRGWLVYQRDTEEIATLKRLLKE